MSSSDPVIRVSSLGTMNTLEAYDLVVFALSMHDKLAQAARVLDQKAEAAAEKGWMEEAEKLLAESLVKAKPLLEWARPLPELRAVRMESAAEVIGVWVDALEKLHAGITFHASSRTPLLPALFSHTKFPALRKASFEVAEEYARELQRRLKASYVERMLGLEEFAFARPIVEQAIAAFEAVVATCGETQLPEDETRAVTEALLAYAKELELRLAQVKLLAQAALVPFESAFDQAGLSQKPKKRRAATEPAGAQSASPARPAEEDAEATVVAADGVDEAAPHPSEEGVEAKPTRAKKSAPADAPKADKPKRAKRAKAKVDEAENVPPSA
jgi:hypothetical protein